MAGVPSAGFRQWREATGNSSVEDFNAWLRQQGFAGHGGISVGQGGLALHRDLEAGFTISPQGQMLNPLFGTPTPRPTSFPGPGAPATAAPPTSPAVVPPYAHNPPYAPPQVQMPDMLPNPANLGTGGGLRDRMMGAVMAPFQRPNWGIPQVEPNYLTRQMPVYGGALPKDVMKTPSPGLGIIEQLKPGFYWGTDGGKLPGNVLGKIMLPTTPQGGTQ